MNLEEADSLSEQIAKYISEQIISGELVEGERIQELRIAKELDVSRGSVREALLLLERTYLIEIFPRRGAIVSEMSAQQVKALFDEANQSAARRFAEEGDARASLYPRLKLEGILDSPLNLCITCDRRRGGPTVLGRTSILEMDLFSACLAVQNLWLAARAEGVGIGWVSILDNQRLAQLLQLPEHIYPLAYLCVGYVSEFLPEPELQRLGWQQRLPLSDLVHLDHWNQHELPSSLQKALEQVSIPELGKGM